MNGVIRQRRSPRLLALTALLLSVGWVSAQEKPLPLVIAHRGASADAPENTGAAIRAALEQKADLIEFDIQATGDGILVLQHDAHLKRFTGKKTSMTSLTFEQARQIDVGTWFDPSFSAERMLLLEEGVAMCLPKARPLVERKTGSAEQVVEQLEKVEALEKVSVIAFDWKFLAAFRALSPKTPIGPLGKGNLSQALPELLPLKPEWVGWKAADLDLKSVEAAHAAGIKVNVWTVDHPKEVAKFARWGVDAITTNRPADTRLVLDNLRY